MCGAKSLIRNAGASLPLLTFARTEEISAAPHSVRIIGFRLPYRSLYFAQSCDSLKLIASRASAIVRPPMPLRTSSHQNSSSALSWYSFPDR